MVHLHLIIVTDTSDAHPSFLYLPTTKQVPLAQYTSPRPSITQRTPATLPHSQQLSARQHQQRQHDYDAVRHSTGTMQPNNNTIESYKAEVRRTHALLKPISTEAAAIFYPTLFEVDPAAKVCIISLCVLFAFIMCNLRSRATCIIRPTTT